MRIGKLPKNHKNLVVERMQQKGLDPVSEFRWEEVQSEKTPGLIVDRVCHTATRHFYTFDMRYMGDDAGIHDVFYFSDCSPPEFSRLHDDWAHQFGSFCGWLDYIKRESDTHDLWNILMQEKELAGTQNAFGAPNTPFTPQEQSSISERLDYIEAGLVKTHNLLESQAKGLARGFDELRDTLKRLGRRDWAHAAIGIVWTTVMGIALAGDQAGKILTSIWNGIRAVLAGMRLLK